MTQSVPVSLNRFSRQSPAKPVCDNVTDPNGTDTGPAHKSFSKFNRGHWLGQFPHACHRPPFLQDIDRRCSVDDVFAEDGNPGDQPRLLIRHLMIPGYDSRQ